MFDKIDMRSQVAVYVQIENQIQYAISSGELKEGDQLPSVRELSIRLEVNPNTVAKSYRDLQVMGLLTSRRGMGVYVIKGAEAKCREESRRRVIERLYEVAMEAKACGMPSTELRDLAKKCYDVEAALYAPAPQSLLSLAKEK